jgi:SAM-dependent methyltransferase
MHGYKYDSVAHTDHEVFCPLAWSKLDYVIGNLSLPPDARVLDLSAGNGELLFRILERFGCRGDALEPSPLMQAEMREEVASRFGDDRVKLIEAEAFELEIEPETYDLILCMGARPYGDTRETLARSWAMVRTGGLLLLGEWHWNDPEPDPDYIDFLGCGPDAYLLHEEIVALGRKEDFTPLYQTTAMRDEIDHYEGQSSWAVERWLRAHPGDPHATQIRDRSRKWRDAYLKWGRYELGFGLYLFRK